ncbi:MAG TPA: efflux RND transporter periplasmic adaptor subunit, partial [Thermoanaerobaculia bacterium]|nr:efflux RND transporter periplasmic adaptor subunit [Thermoanaerobaculia bacterium]
IGIAVAVAALAGFLLFSRRGSAAPKFRKAKVDRGEVVATVTATGTLSAVTTVQVGSQVSGIIAKLHVDFNSKVVKGQLLAELDPTPFLQTVEQRRADLEKAKVELRNSEISLVRAKSLNAQQLLAQSDLDAAQTTRDSAAATVSQAQAALKQAETNLSYTKITSPIDGVVVSRQYDVGQTVAASFQAPVLFTIAQDLTKMQVLTNIDEADVGRIKVGQVANFTVDAFSDLTFKGTVSQIRLSPQTVQNVVTYPVMLDVPNADLKLMPGMTANVQIPVEDRKDVLRVPNAALRFRPDNADLVPEARKDKAKGAPSASTSSPAAPETGSMAPPAGTPPSGGRPGGAGGRGPGGRPGGGSGTRPGGTGVGTLYVEVPNTGGKLRPVTVRTLITDGNLTAIQTNDLKEGDEIIVSLATARAGLPGGGTGAPGGGRRPF